MQSGLVARKVSVRLSVRLSVKRVDCDKTKEKSVKIFIPYERSFSLVFWENAGDSNLSVVLYDAKFRTLWPPVKIRGRVGRSL